MIYQNDYIKHYKYTDTHGQNGEICQKAVSQKALGQWFYRNILSASKTNDSNIPILVILFYKLKRMEKNSDCLNELNNILVPNPSKDWTPRKFQTNLNYNYKF